MEQSIRKKAEDLLRYGYSPDDPISDRDLPEIIHELQVHQIELEMQNDELRKAQEEIQKAQKKYFDLFNFAPVGYLTLDERGIVKDINLTGAAMLGRERRFVTERPFIAHLDATQREFMAHLAAVFNAQQPQTCELTLKSKTGKQTCIRLRSVVRSEGTRLVCWSVMTDITELRRAEEAREISDSQLRMALDAGQMCTWHRDVTTDEINFSQHIHDILGLSPGYPLNSLKEFMKFIHPADLPALNQAIDEARLGKTYSMQYRVIWPNGEIHWIESMGKAYLNESGEPVRSAGTLRDVTRRKEMELALAEERSLLSQRVAERTADLVQANQTLLISKQRNEALYKFAQVILEVQDTAALLHSAAEAISAILPADRVLVYLLDSQNEKVLHFTKAGPGAATTPQVSYEELAEGLTGWVIREIKPALSPGSQPDPRESAAVQQRRTSVTAGSTIVVPMPLQAKVLGTITAVNPPDGREFNENDLEIVQSMANQTAVALKNISLNDSLRQQSEKLRLANVELARASRLKDEFLANMSHELRTPLNAILGMSELLKRRVYGQLSAKQERAVDHIDDGGRHLLDLINDILDLSKIEADKLELYFDTISIAEVSEASLRFILGPAMQKEIKIISNIDPSLDTIVVDERRLKQILVNLLYNAVKFTPAGGQVGLDVTPDPENETVLFSVWDTGIGIAEKDSQRLFQPFVQLDSRLAKEHEGTGLGLTLVHRLTELHGGSIALQSTVGEGSRFTIALPQQSPSVDQGETVPLAAAKEAAEPNQRHFARNGRSPYRILLAEDNEANGLFITDALHSQGYPIIRANDGREAVKLARERKPDLILMDVQMPGMDGLQAIRQIRADENGQVAQIPIITVTALAMSGDKEQILQAGANEYLSKPVNLNKLFELLETFLPVSKEH